MEDKKKHLLKLRILLLLLTTHNLITRTVHTKERIE